MRSDHQRLHGGAAMTREKLEQLPHDPGCRTAWLSADAHCTCTRARTLAWVAAMERVIAAYEARLGAMNSAQTADELGAARRALAELEGS